MTSSTVDSTLHLANKYSDVTRDGKIEQGNFYTRSTSNVIRDLGDAVQMTSIDIRLKAVQFRDGKKPIVSYNEKSQVFTRIAARAAKREIKCMVGVKSSAWLAWNGFLSSGLQGLRTSCPS